ncbi:uncharacterized protein PFLUO_LOCUS4830 [Penicillium psychrofluorescens]|uniref:uncharacterized protein n=1 Tax=Penicillium psychrofluorescens TaxID=3158075 RepID=UPI003CCCE9E4
MVPRQEEDGHARGQRALVVTATLTAIAATIVGMRLFARAGLMKIMGREDWAILVSLCLWAAIPMYNASLACTKFSILFQYLRIFPLHPFRLICYIMMGIVATYSSWAIVTGYVNCVPVAKFWNHDLPGHCLNFEAIWFFNAAMNIATDLTLLSMPMPMLSQLRLPRMQKIALIGVFAIGILVVITSILRLSSLRIVAQSTDTSYSNVDAAYWTAAECNVAIICASLPFLRPLISRLFPGMLSSHNRTGYGRTPATKNISLMTPSPTFPTFAAAAQRPRSELLDNREEYDMYSISVKHGEGDTPGSSLNGIEITTEMTLIRGASGRIEQVATSKSHLVDA